MLFNSVDFLLFLPVVVGLYFATPARWRWSLLLAASYYFYASWKLEYLTLIIASTLVDYVVGLRMGRIKERRKRLPLLYVSILSNLGLLFVFKYANFASDSLQVVLTQFNQSIDLPTMSFLLPVGISFYTFQTLSYSIEVYRGEMRPERHLGVFALYVSFFPQLVAGPIERSSRLLPQFRRVNRFEIDRFVSGLKLMTWGFFLKVVVADRMSTYVNAVFDNPGDHVGIPVVLAAFLFSFQIYGDFAGYSLIAIGSAKLMGYDLMENFRRPYLATSIADFWRRWHISLSTWFRDYVYIPIGGNRVVKWRAYYNVVVVFLVSGLWHGANWTFVFWGGLHGLFMVLSGLTETVRNQVWKPLVRFSIGRQFRYAVSVVFTFGIVLVAWLFFRASTIQEAFQLIGDGLRVDRAQLSSPRQLTLGALTFVEFCITISLPFFVMAYELLEQRESVWLRIQRLPMPMRWAVYYSLVFSILIFGVFGQQQFLYFQF